jgi:hypothetical protein
VADAVVEAPTVPPRPSREYRAAVALSLTAIFTLAILALYGNVMSVFPPVTRAVTLAGPGTGAFVGLLMAFGLARGATWARSAMTPVLWLVVVSGSVSFVLALMRGSIDIPLGALLAIWALRAPPTIDRRPSPLGRAIVGVMTIVAAWPLIALLALQPGGVLLTAESDFDASLELSGACPGSGVAAPGDAPEAIDVTFRWSWHRAEPFREGIDELTITWFTFGAGEDLGYYQDQPLPQAAGVTEEDRWIGRTTYRIDLAQQSFEPGEVRIRLLRATPPPPGLGEVNVMAQFLHAPTGSSVRPALWGAVEQARCEW